MAWASRVAALLVMASMVMASTAFVPSSLVGSRALPRVVTYSTAASGEVGAVDSCRRKLQEQLKPTQLIVKSSNDDPNGSHIAVKVVSSTFEGLNRVKRQQAVYKVIWEELQGPIHAVDQLICLTPEEDGASSS